MVGPRMMPIDTIEPVMPSARPRSVGGKVSVTMAGPSARIIAAPTAWMMRPATSQPTPGANPHSADAAVKTMNPVA